MLTFPWDLARKMWKGKTITVQPEGGVTWRGGIQDSYYLRRYENDGDVDPFALRIRALFRDRMCSKQFPNVNAGEEMWTRCHEWPHLIVSARLTDLHVIDDSFDKGGGDLWCLFETPVEHVYIGEPSCQCGWLIVHMGDMKGKVLKYAKKVSEQKFKFF